jgi:CheY-like chemotaxis protein
MRVLIVEDVDHKFEDVLLVLSRGLGRSFDHVRARTVVEATDQIELERWDLVILDISMDIAPGSGGSVRDGHANLGGMDVIEHMFLLEVEVPTIILTGFDYFVKSGSESGSREAQTIHDLERQARRFIGSRLLGCIRYGVTAWDHNLTNIVRILK